jgi:hypothetical protein
MTIASVLSETRTVLLTVQAVLNDRTFTSFADRTLSGSEDALSAIDSSFSVVQPPTSAADHIREDTTQLVDDASTAVESARIALRRHDRAALEEASGKLKDAADALEQAE